MPAVLAGLPILLILALMIGARWSAARAGLSSLVLATGLALIVFGFGSRTLPELGPARALGFSLVEASFTTATILWIIFPALCIYELQSRSGAFDDLRRALSRISDEPRILVLLVAWFFGLFMEGAAGFGTPVALAAPLLVSLGFSPVKAVVLALVGHAAGVSFGAVGTPVLAQVSITDLSAGEIARATGLLHALLGWIMILFLLRLSDSKPLSARDFGLGALAAFCFLAPAYVFAWATGPELPTLGGALVGLVAFVALLRRMGHGGAAPEEEGGSVLRAALPYAILLVLILATRLVPVLQETLRSASLDWSLPGPFGGSFEPFYHPGTMLMIGFLAGGLAQGREAADLAKAAGAAAVRLAPVVIALVAMLAISRIMVHSGMIEELADAAAGAGAFWPLLAPTVGVLGTFVTGSATASNILFTEFQVATAQALGLPALAMVAAQGFGAAVGNIVCPHNIIAGGATVGLQGREGEAMRRTALACAAYALAGGIATFALLA